MTVATFARVKPKLNATKNYRLFERSADNRPMDMTAHRKLRRSMKKYGFLPCFPLGVVRGKNDVLIVKDGQHRLAFAEELGLPVWYVLVDTDFDIAEINDTPKTWKTKDYAEMHAANGKTQYKEGIDFAEIYGLTIGNAFSLLAGTIHFTNVSDQFKAGTFVIKDREWAERVASVYSRICAMSKDVRNSHFLSACMAACRVEDFSAPRLVKNSQRCRDKLISYSTREAYLDMIEEIYNFGHKNLMAIKLPAIQTMRERSAAYAKEQEAAIA